MSMSDKEDLFRKLEKNEITQAQAKKLLKTPPNDPRYPECNQAKNCYTKYNEFFRCEKFLGHGAVKCFWLKQEYKSLCPSEWVERWDEQRAEGVFPGPL
mmetsp:Transcript_31512/g.73754  ORF Transcript_31512/g.73754 Transcript_31512/m.73754 type:complete len:99 (+) Transcript_31512:237-533(+)